MALGGNGAPGQRGVARDAVQLVLLMPRRSMANPVARIVTRGPCWFGQDLHR